MQVHVLLGTVLERTVVQGNKDKRKPKKRTNTDVLICLIFQINVIRVNNRDPQNFTST